MGEAPDAGLQSVLERPVPPGADSISGVIALDDFEVGEQTNYSANITPVSDAEFDAIESLFTRMDNFEYGPYREGTGLKLGGDGTSFSLLKPWENPNFDYTASLVTGTASPVVGNPNAGIWKRLDNTLTGGLFLNNNSVVDQADTEAYSNTSFFGIDGVTHGDVYDASMTTAEYLGYAELGLAVGSLKAFVRNLDADNAKYAADSSARNNPLGARGPATAWEGFDESLAGGPIRDLTTDNIRISDRGIDVVVQHTNRFGPDKANDVMIDRLRQISSGDLTPTPQDLNFYSHELREFVRYRSQGWESGVPANSDQARQLWLNTHSATLDDYNLPLRSDDLLYHPDALRYLDE